MRFINIIFKYVFTVCIGLAYIAYNEAETINMYVYGRNPWKKFHTYPFGMLQILFIVMTWMKQ